MLLNFKQFKQCSRHSVHDLGFSLKGSLFLWNVLHMHLLDTGKSQESVSNSKCIWETNVVILKSDT